jgi:hypothetical protein
MEVNLKEMVKRKGKAKVGVQVTGRSVAYIQTVSKSGKPGKARPVILTTVAVRKQVKK